MSSEYMDAAGVSLGLEKFPPAPADDIAESAWDKIATLARSNCLIVQAYGGVMVLATPHEQRRQGIRGRVLLTHERKDCHEDFRR